MLTRWEVPAGSRLPGSRCAKSNHLISAKMRVSPTHLASNCIFWARMVRKGLDAVLEQQAPVPRLESCQFFAKSSSVLIVRAHIFTTRPGSILRLFAGHLLLAGEVGLLLGVHFDDVACPIGDFVLLLHIIC
eukprot:EG_transcript_43134